MAIDTNLIGTLKKRSEFLYVAQGKKAHGRFLSLQMRPKGTVQMRPKGTVQSHIPNEADSVREDIRFGLTASKKTGNAVKRNRARRRLRAALQQILPKYGALGHDYVAIARPQTCEADWQALVSDIIILFQKLNPIIENKSAQ